MSKIEKHPILDIPVREKCSFLFNGKEVECESGYTIAAALHNAGYPVHSHSLSGRKRSLACGIGKCGACEMVVDGEVKRICITKVDGVKQVEEIGDEWKVGEEHKPHVEHFKCDVVIIGAGPAGLSARETLLEKGVNCVIVDNNDTIGGQFNMQTHQFFFFEEKHRFGGMRGFDIAQNLAGDNH
ncbi:MAG: (2Fe-2S)-binding protein, partial [Odoribacter sp.]|nr:(2Fe-2S)-binding protein [Odoribacter sp.]